MRGVPRGRAALVAAVLALAALAGAAGCAGQPEPASRGQVSAGDRRWLDQAHQADLAEITAGGHGETNGTTPAIRAAGAILVRDHTRFDARLVRVATRLKVTLPGHQTIKQTEIGDRLASESGPAFDHDFTASMMTAHQYLISATAAELRSGHAPLVTGLARQALPVLRKHLAMMRALAATG